MADTPENENTPATGEQTDDETRTTEGTPAGDSPLERALKAERESAKAARREVRTLKAQLEEATGRLASLDDLTNRAEGAEDKAANLEAKLLRYEVAAEKGIDLKLAARLSGTTREEMVSDADELLSLVAPKQGAPDFDGGPRDPATPKKDPEKEHADFIVGLLRGATGEAS